MSRIITNLWFDTEGEEAAEFYCSVFSNSRITGVTRCSEQGPSQPGMVMAVDFELDGTPFTAINGGPQFTFDEAISLLIECEDQLEIDHYWDTLTEGGEESMCGWLKDRYGLSWQVAPKQLGTLLSDPGTGAAVMATMLQMRKIDLAALECAAHGEPAGADVG